MSARWTGPAAEAGGQDTTYVTEISGPRLGDDGVQRLHAAMTQEPPEADIGEPEAL